MSSLMLYTFTGAGLAIAIRLATNRIPIRQTTILLTFDIPLIFFPLFFCGTKGPRMIENVHPSYCYQIIPLAPFCVTNHKYYTYYYQFPPSH